MSYSLAVAAAWVAAAAGVAVWALWPDVKDLAHRILHRGEDESEIGLDPLDYLARRSPFGPMRYDHNGDLLADWEVSLLDAGLPPHPDDEPQHFTSADIDWLTYLDLHTFKSTDHGSN